MTPDPRTYMGHAIAGTDPGDIDDWVGRWHDAAGASQSLPDFLGMTNEEYGNWVIAPEALPHMIETRRLVEAARTAFTHMTAKLAGRVN